MDEASLIALHHQLKSGAPRGRTGGMGLGLQRARRAVNSDLPDNKLYKNFVREGAVLTEEEWLGGPKFEGKRETFGEEDSGSGAGAVPAAPPAAAPPAPLTLRAMKGVVRAYLAGCKRQRAKQKFARSVAVEEAAGEGAGQEEEEAAGELFDRAVRKLVKKGVCALVEEGGAAVLVLCSESAPQDAAAVADEAEGGRAKRSKRS